MTLEEFFDTKVENAIRECMVLVKQSTLEERLQLAEFYRAEAEQLESIARYSAKYQRSQTELDTRLLANESSRLINSLITLNCIAEEKIRKIVEEINKEVTEE